MHLNARIAIKLYLAFAILCFVEFCFEGFSSFGHFATKENWNSVLHYLAFGAGGAIYPTGLVMLGVWSNSWFKEGIARRAKRRFQKHSGNQEYQHGR